MPCGIGISPVILCEFCFRFKEPRKKNKTNANSSCRYCCKRLGLFFSINVLNHIYNCLEKPHIPGKSWADIKCYCTQTSPSMMNTIYRLVVQVWAHPVPRLLLIYFKMLSLMLHSNRHTISDLYMIFGLFGHIGKTNFSNS